MFFFVLRGLSDSYYSTQRVELGSMGNSALQEWFIIIVIILLLIIIIILFFSTTFTEPDLIQRSRLVPVETVDAFLKVV